MNPVSKSRLKKYTSLWIHSRLQDSTPSSWSSATPKQLKFPTWSCAEEWSSIYPQKKNFPAKNWTPMIPKTSQNRRHTVITFPIAGIQCIRAFTTTFIDSHLEIALRGRKARSVRMDRRDVTPEAFAPIPIQEMTTIMKSRTVQNEVK